MTVKFETLIVQFRQQLTNENVYFSGMHDLSLFNVLENVCNVQHVICIFAKIQMSNCVTKVSCGFYFSNEAT